MKRIWLILLIPQVGFCATPTPAQVEQAKICFDQILDCAIDGARYVNAAQLLFNRNGQLTVPGSTNTVTIPQVLIDETVNKYQAKRQACVTAFNICP